MYADPLNCTGYPCRSTHECVPLKWRCDGIHDCLDNSDEIGCEIDVHERCKSEEGRFLCNDGLCLPPASVCNNETDCMSAEDEGDHCISGKLFFHLNIEEKFKVLFENSSYPVTVKITQTFQ